MVYGTWRLLDTKPTAQEINRRLHACLELGITTLDTAEIYGLYEVEQASGGGHDHVGTASHGHHLRIDRDAAKNGVNRDGSGEPTRELTKFFGNLSGELSRGYEHQGEQAPRALLRCRSKPFEQRKPERGSLSRAGLRTGEHVAPSQNRGDRGRLDGRRVRVATSLDGGQQLSR